MDKDLNEILESIPTKNKFMMTMEDILLYISGLQCENNKLKLEIKQLENVLIRDKFNFAKPHVLTYKVEILETRINNLIKKLKYDKRKIDEKLKKQDFGSNYINDYRKARLRGIRTKINEVLKYIEGDLNE